MSKHRKDPFQSVITATLHDDDTGGRFWGLMLECGHEDTRPVRYLATAKKTKWGGARKEGRIRSLEDLAPAPSRVRCDLCR